MAQDFDLTKLTADQLDELLARAAKHRASLQPGPLNEHPKRTYVVVSPAWHTGLVDAGTISDRLPWLRMARVPHPRK